MCHVEVYEEQSHEGGGSQDGEHHVDVHGRCAEHGEVLPGDLHELHGLVGLW